LIATISDARSGAPERFTGSEEKQFMDSLTVAELVRDRRADELIRLPASASVADAVAVMAAREVGAVLVMTEDDLVAGIFSERDLLARVVAAGRDPKATPLSMVMTRDVKFVTPGTATEAALALMHLHRFRHLLVIDGPRVLGLISMRDLVVQIVTRGEGRYERAVREAEL
jgi:CBS domain-containing protein